MKKIIFALTIISNIAYSATSNQVDIGSNGTVTVNAGTNLNTSTLAVESGGNLATLTANSNLSQASTTAGQAGSLFFGAAKTSNPTYVNGNSYPLTMDTSGRVRVTSDTANTSLATISDNQTNGTQVTGILGTVPLPTGAATAAAQTTAQTSLSSIVTNTTGVATAANQTTMAGNQTNGTQLTRITNGTQTADTVGGDSGQNGLVLNPAVKSITYTGITATTASIDIGNYKSISIMTSAISGAWTVQASNDNVNWLSAPMVRSDTGAFSASLAVNVIYKGSTWGKYFRILAGTSLTASISFSANPDPSTAVVVTPTGGAVFSASQSGSWTVTSNGGQASGASLSGNPTRIGAAFNTTQPTVTTGQAVDVQASNRGSLYVTNGVEGALINKPYAVSTSDWNYAAASGGITNTTTAVTIAPAAGGALRNYATAIQLSTTALGVSTEIAIRDGAGGTVLWRGTLSTTAANPSAFTLPSPIRGSANTLMEVVTLTASVTGSVYFNAQGYTAP